MNLRQALTTNDKARINYYFGQQHPSELEGLSGHRQLAKV
jgi:hypothetical protein